MGVFKNFFDKFRNNNEPTRQMESTNNSPIEESPFDIEYSYGPNGSLQVDFYDKNADFKQFYDTTRLIIGNQPFYVEGHQVFQCNVSWYGHNDCQMLDKRTGKMDSLSAQDYQEVFAEIDLNLLCYDPNYCNTLMKKLLNKTRVEKYLENGLQESPEQPCGSYIGTVMKTQNGYRKFFSEAVGRASHYSNAMVNRRQEHRAMVEAQRQKAIENKRAQIEKLQSELYNMEK